MAAEIGTQLLVVRSSVLLPEVELACHGSAWHIACHVVSVSF